MIDVTRTIEFRRCERVPGRAVPDEIWHNGYLIGYVDSGNVRIVDKRYRARIVPQQAQTNLPIEQHIFRLNDNDLEATKAGRY